MLAIPAAIRIGMTAQAIPTISERFGAATARISRRLSSRTWEVNVVDPTCDADWDELVASHPESSFFHSAAWSKVLCQTYRHKPASLLLSKDAEPVALVPLLEINSSFTGRRGICLPFTDFCDPLLFRECDPGVVPKLIHELARSRSWTQFEMRGRDSLGFRTTPSVTFYGHKLDLRSGAKSLLSGFADSVRRAIRKASLANLDLQIGNTQQAMRDFYRIHARTRRRHGLPPAANFLFPEYPQFNH